MGGRKGGWTVSGPFGGAQVEVLDAFSVDTDDPCFVRPVEHTFIFLSSGTSRLKLLYGKEENYQKGVIEFKELPVTVMKYLGRKCAACGRPVEGLYDVALSVHQGKVEHVLHESCFKKWFNEAAAKGGLAPYRLCKVKRAKMGVASSSFKVQISGKDPVEEYPFTALRDISPEEIMDEPPHRPAQAPAVGIGAVGGAVASSAMGAAPGGEMMGASASAPRPVPASQAAMAAEPQVASARVVTELKVKCPCCGKWMLVRFESVDS